MSDDNPESHLSIQHHIWKSRLCVPQKDGYCHNSEIPDIKKFSQGLNFWGLQIQYSGYLVLH